MAMVTLFSMGKESTLTASRLVGYLSR